MIPLAVSRAASVFGLFVLHSSCGSSPSEPPPPPCDPSPLGVGSLFVDLRGFMPDPQHVYRLWVVEAGPEVLRLEGDQRADPEDEPYVIFGSDGLVSAHVGLPELGDEVLVQGRIHCGYVRFADSEGELLFEGGDPACLLQEDLERWEPPPHLGLRPAPEPRLCQDECMSGLAWEVTVGVGGIDVLVPIGESREVEIDGRRFLAETFYARFDDHDCGVIDADGLRASAYLGVLRE